jgi:putative zinc-dependent peptidase DUF5700
MIINAQKARRLLCAISLGLPILCPLSDGRIVIGVAGTPRSLNRQIDVAQAEAMLVLLRSSVCGQVDPHLIEAVLNAHGTALIISQQNISRTVKSEQYRTLLLALNCDQLPDIAPVDESERSRRGVEGLRKDVWPALRWGSTNTNLLAERIEEVKGIDVLRRAVTLANKSLPETVQLSPNLYVVLGGRAGAAALDSNDIYFDVLATSYKAAKGTLQYPGPEQIVEYFAHETHHIGLSQIINRTRSKLRLNNQEQRAFGFLTALVMEGSASYLINGHRSLEVMRRDPQFAENLKNGDELLKLTEQLLKSVLQNNLDDEGYEKATTPFLGSGWHCVGALMLSAIDRASGSRAVMDVLRDPRKLLAAYNRAIVGQKSTVGQKSLNKTLAKRISSMGT